MKLLQSIKNNIPNAITCLNLLCGAMAVICAFSPFDVVCGSTLQGYQMAVAFIALAMVADFCDGFAARLLGAVSAIGKELDSLSDLVSFGLAPAMLLFNVMKVIVPGNLCFMALLIPVFGALRLARFNVDTNQSTTFTGLPIPANAMFWVGYTWTLANLPAGYTLSPWSVVIVILIVSPMMVSNLRMFSLKLHSLKPKDAWRQYVIVIATVLLVAWLGVPGLAWVVALYGIMAAIDAILLKNK